jgi:hypothetical protein
MARKTVMSKEPGNISIALPKSEKERLQRRKASPLRRLSPGVYRNLQGQLVGSKGQALPKQPQPQPTPQDYEPVNMAPNMQSGYLPAPSDTQMPVQNLDTQMPVQNLMYNYPPGQAPNMLQPMGGFQYQPQPQQRKLSPLELVQRRFR